jgi:uncharacterized protein YggU (UPF0235/DUF167 family)
VALMSTPYDPNEVYPIFLFSYRFDGSEWTVDIPAKNKEEALERIKALAWAKYDGVLVERVPVKGRTAQGVATFLAKLFGRAR